MLILYLSQALVGLSSEELCSSPQKRELGDTKTQDLEKAVILVKPDGVQRGYVGEIISRFEQKGFQLIAMKMEMADRSTLEDHYEGWHCLFTSFAYCPCLIKLQLYWLVQASSVKHLYNNFNPQDG